jgi:hypothetical protein
MAGSQSPARGRSDGLDELSLCFWCTRRGFRGVPAGGPLRLVEGIASLGYMTPAANAASRLAQAKVPPKP